MCHDAGKKIKILNHQKPNGNGNKKSQIRAPIHPDSEEISKRQNIQDLNNKAVDVLMSRLTMTKPSMTMTMMARTTLDIRVIGQFELPSKQI